MLKSMTGYGVHKVDHQEYDISIEVKSLNSKFLDANFRGLPKQFADKEIEIRNLLSSQLIRGKVTISFEITEKGVAEPKAKVNKILVQKYYEQLDEAADLVDGDKSALFQIAMQMPKAIEAVSDEKNTEEQWEVFLSCVKEAVSKCNSFRSDEGTELYKKLISYIDNIESFLNEVIELDPQRVEGVKDRIKKHLEEFVSVKETIDESRFEQEMIYYIEKLDITEEKVRLKNHLDYFRTISSSNKENGKKLGFISQEIGREINTIGSKSNHSEMQKIVVNMKDELEKIKEQVLNVL